MRRLATRLIFSLAISPLAVLSQSPRPDLVPRRLDREEAQSSPDLVKAITDIRAVTGGAVFVNDRASRRVIMLDSSLRIEKVVLDATPANGANYGRIGTRLIAMPGDSTMFVDAETWTVAVFDARGNVVRRGPVPARADRGQLLLGAPAFDTRGRLVYRGPGRSQRELIQMTTSGQKSTPETVPIVRLDLVAGRIDTATLMRIYQPAQKTYSSENAGVYSAWVRPVLHPIPIVDEWAMAADGRIAIVRGDEFRVEYVDSAGVATKGAPITFVARPLDQTSKVALIEASRTTRARALAAGLSIGRDVAPLPGVVVYSAPTTRIVTSSDRAGFRVAGPDSSDDAVWVSPDELPNQMPAFLAGGVRADADGNVWVLRATYSETPSGFTYDVIGASGELVDRVQVPEGNVIVGFARGRVVLLARRDATGLRLVRMRYTGSR